jgi:hypothetical protein
MPANNHTMLVRVTIDDDLIAQATAIAQESQTSIDQVICHLLRQALTQHAATHYNDGFPIFAVTHASRPITAEDVQGANDEV